MFYHILETCILLCRAGFAVMLLIAGVTKLANINDFAITLSNLVSSTPEGRLVRFVAFLFPLLELCLGLLVISGLWSLTIDGAVLFLMLMFNGVILFALKKAPNSTCQCFGSLSGTRFNLSSFFRSVVLTLVAFGVFFFHLLFSLPLGGIPGGWEAVVLVSYAVLAFVAVQVIRVVDDIKRRVAA